MGGRAGSAARYSSPDASAEHRDEEDLESSCGQEAQASGTVGADGTSEAAGNGGLKGMGQIDLAQRQGIQTPEIRSAHASCNEGMIAGQSIDRAAERHPGELHTVHRG